MAICKTYVFCRCDTYTSHKGCSAVKNHTFITCANHRPTDEEKLSRQDHDKHCTTVDVQCYSYSTDCASYSGRSCNSDTTEDYAYSCPGHRNYQQNSDISFASYSTGNIIDNNQINIIQNYIRSEIQQRKNHAMYSTESSIKYTDTNVSTSNIIDNSTPNNIELALTKLRTRINSLEDYVNTHSKSYHNINNNTIAYASSIKPLEDELNTMWKDCICYSDCIAYGLWKYKDCTCNVNCICDYA